MSATSSLVSTKECDYLEEDKPIRGQNFALLSFLSPEDVLANKEVYYFGKFIDSFSKELLTLLDGFVAKYPESKTVIDAIKETNNHFFDGQALQDHYKFFKSVHGDDIEKEFHAANDFRTTVRGIKVRGVFDTLKEAQTRAEVLKRMGDKFDIYIAQVGAWCPWNPNPEQLESQEYAETHLNTLMKNYKEQMQLKDEVFEQRKQEKIAQAKKEVEEKKAAEQGLAEQLQETDAWTKRKQEEAGTSSDN